MSGILLLDAAILAISIFNAILLTWLGFTVLLNSDRLRWGIYLAGGSLLLGALFFISHTAVLGQGLLRVDRNTLVFWFLVGILSAVILPYAWYVTMLWYAGYWQDKQSALSRRQRPWFWLASFLLLLGSIAILAIMVSLGISQSRYGPLSQTVRWSAAGVPLVVITFSSYLLLNIGLALDALYRPGPSARAMGQLARRRARPWLIAASLSLLIVGLLVALVLARVGLLAQGNSLYSTYSTSTFSLALFDLLISGLIGLVILLLGQAVVSYEVFTGKTLPRRGLLRHWQRAIALAAAAGLLISAAITLAIPAIYALLITVLAMTLFYALVSWRSYVERERLMGSLRPFITSQGLYDQLVTNAAVTTDPMPAFEALCAEVLEAKRAYLTAVGPLAPLVEKPLIFPPEETLLPPALPDHLPPDSTSGVGAIDLDPAESAGFLWALPLWSERGQIGLLFLGEKRGGGLYTQEEMEIARFTGERIVDALAAAALAARLMALQRQRLVQTQVADQRTRRILHDEILPNLHSAMIAISATPASSAGNQETALQVLTETHQELSELLRALPPTTVPDIQRRGLLLTLQTTINREFAPQFDGLEWQIEPAAQENTSLLAPLAAEVLYYAAREVVRNAARYGRAPDGADQLILKIHASWNNGLELRIMDNGVGLGHAGGDVLHNGQGLALHSTMMAVIGGSLSLDSSPGSFTRVTLFAPLP